MNAEQTLQQAYNLKAKLSTNDCVELNSIIEYLKKEIFEKTLPSHSEKKTYAATQKLLKKMSKDPRKILGYTKKYEIDGKTYQAFTDTYQAYFLNKTYEQLPDADTDGKGLGSYPDLTRIFPQCNPRFGHTKLNKKEVSDFVKSVDKNTLEDKNIVPYSFTMDNGYKAYVNAKFLLTAFDILGDTLDVYGKSGTWMIEFSSDIGCGIICQIRHY